ncbi:MAG TPA: protein-disulfide reductase DsbD domain-containing protein [Bryobacteraceae bacterium]|nr:protein-disulfide reductase DsbD domain-containing protein [Bryobacteraceae bacterium]
MAPPPKVVAQRGAAADAKISVQLQPGYHVNSNTPSEDYLIPLKLTWTPAALDPANTVYPKPKQEKYQFSPKPLSVFTGNFELVTHFKVPAAAQRGPGILLGKLRYQACNDNACFPPKTVEVRLPYEVR